MLDFPDRFVGDADEAALAARVKRYTALVMFAGGELSAGAAAELAGIDRFELVENCRERGLALASYDFAELTGELESLDKPGG